MKGSNGVALVTVIIFIVLISIIAVAMLSLMGGQAVLIEHQVQRIKAQYIAEAAIWKNFMNFTVGTRTPPNKETPVPSPPEQIDGLPYQADVDYQTGTGPNGTDTISATVSY